MRLPNSVHQEAPWRIREIARDFTLEDVWALPTPGGPDDFPALLDLLLSADPASTKNLPTRFLWGARDLLGKVFGLGRISTSEDEVGGLSIPGTSESSLSARLPEDLRVSADDLQFDHLPFVPLYRTADEFAAELSNQTVHAVMHLAWVDQGEGAYLGQMAVYVKPRGRLGKAYMAFIKPFRYAIVYPALTRRIDADWKARSAGNG